MTGFDGLSKSQKVRATLHRDVRSICTETCHFLGLEITKPAMEIIAELVYKKLAIYGTDLEAFAKHAKRATVNSEDVKLLVRRNPSLKSHLNAIAPVPNSAAKDKRRKTVAASTTRQDTPAKTNDDIPTASRQMNNDFSATRQVDKDVPVIRHMELAPAKVANSKTRDMEEPKKQDEFEDMVIDDTIDLTFD